MADKELRKMSRMELVEIIYALQQNERTLREENTELKEQLDDKILRMNKAGSIAEAALGLNRIFEDADAAAEQYLATLQAAEAGVAQVQEEAQQKADEMISEAEANASRILEEAQRKADEVTSEAEANAARIQEDAQQKADEMISAAEERDRQSEERLQHSEEECQAMLKETERDIQKRKQAFVISIRNTLEKYPGLAGQMKKDADERKKQQAPR